MMSFCFQFIYDIICIWWWMLLRQPIIVVTTESGGLGDYIWIRSYYAEIRKHYHPQKCRIVVAGMKHWTQMAVDLDGNLLDIYREFDSCDNPRKSERLFFRLFVADVFFDFRAINQMQLVRARKTVFGVGCNRSKVFYREVNDSVFSQWSSLSEGFRHTFPIHTIKDASRKRLLEKPYIVFVEKGNTQGGFSDSQIVAICRFLISLGYHIFYNGNFIKVSSLFKQDEQCYFIDGYQFSLSEYGAVVNDARMIVTINTFIYHIAVQLDKPCVVISVNEYSSIDLLKDKQEIVFNKSLYDAYQENRLSEYQADDGATIANLEISRIKEAIDNLNSHVG